MAVSKLALIRVTELALIGACIVLHYRTFECPVIEKLFGGTNTLHRTMLATSAFGGFALLSLAGTLAHLLGAPLEKRTDAIMSAVGCCLFVWTGAWILDEYKDAHSTEYKSEQLTKAASAIVTGAVLLGHAFLAVVEK